MTMDSFVYRKVDSKYFDYPVDVLGLNYYEEDSAGEDDFSRKQVWFYVYGDEEIKKEFKSGMKNMFEGLFGESQGYWDFMTLMPSHEKGGFNRNMLDLVEDISDEIGVDFRKVLHRNHTIRDNHELDSLKEKVINSEASIDVQEDVEGKNILLVDNLSLTGCSLMQVKQLLKNHGADKVVCMVLGVDTNGSDDMKFDESSKGKILENLEVDYEGF